ncbi:CpsB/CapC family capsule biosynthesis tyrosine phosphatase [Peribacillus simplex]|uniref:Tyrosine-protein phosphatase n=2 Tax=Peribacillus TaxID=2675229 RepID=A0AA90NYS8_9BACI|nr:MULTISPECIES: CpsB/CapC family capsule biosynthesis tyrosine phosphatase [Peribacillus]MDP1417443.1 CpsB/CapC family capsule biosynthesis tyrosine phosphatase [Peribacillus simplex]MDP1450098.1 CpsB/CapC family capsule biosynthesis tyrosine phosphatase [Peribacillus frigoritolerans]
MIDIHCHILPGVDDGSVDMKESMNMARKAIEAGITHIFATPHHLNEKYVNVKSDIIDRAVRLNESFQLENIPLTIHLGQEVRIHRDIFSSLEKEEILTLDDNGTYLLLELPSGRVPTYTREVIYELLLKGITPIIVHPERNKELIENHKLLFELVEEGALTQLTSGSIIGNFGKSIQSFSKKIIEHNLAHFIATDAHNIGSRGFTLQHAYETITKAYGIQRTFYFKENAERLLKNQSPTVEKPVPFKKKILGIF